ncbi:hypothetical protein ColTof3_08324 [Colletotrichum tofieldiae]|nr:hypothetical protein ColTof3_08324 [Colletotrichum tofieldiae]
MHRDASLTFRYLGSPVSRVTRVQRPSVDHPESTIEAARPLADVNGAFKANCTTALKRRRSSFYHVVRLHKAARLDPGDLLPDEMLSLPPSANTDHPAAQLKMRRQDCCLSKPSKYS